MEEYLFKGPGRKQMEEKKCIRCLNHLYDFVVYKDIIFLDSLAFEECISKGLAQVYREEIRRAVREMEATPTSEERAYWVQRRNQAVISATADVLVNIIQICEKEIKEQ
jgi:hypothetical protein